MTISQSLGNSDSDSGANDADGGSSHGDGGTKTTTDAGTKTHDGGAVKSDASIAGGWTTEPFDNPDGLVIDSA